MLRSDWITFSTNGNNGVLFYTYNICGPRDAYSYWDAPSTQSWVAGSGENRYYFISEIEINGGNSTPNPSALPSALPSPLPSPQPTDGSNTDPDTVSGNRKHIFVS